MSFAHKEELDSSAHIKFLLWAQFDASRRGKKMLNFSRDKNEGTYRSGEGGGGPAM